jgi:putative transcriptional regulator
MAIKITLDAMIAKLGMTGNHFVTRDWIERNPDFFISVRQGARHTVTTLERLCAVLECRPGDLIDYEA